MSKGQMDVGSRQLAMMDDDVDYWSESQSQNIQAHAHIQNIKATLEDMLTLPFVQLAHNFYLEYGQITLIVIVPGNGHYGFKPP